MRLISFEYKDYSSEIKGLHFEEVSLIVGKNAVGKSRTISALRKAFQIILQKREIKSYDDFYYKLTFIEEDRELYYDFKCDYGSILSEHLTDSNDEEYISRDTDETIFYKDPINPPADKLTINVRRDTVKYPEVENIISWAEQSYGFLFNQIDIGYSENTSSYSIMSHSEGVITMFEQLDVNSRECVIKKMNELGYKIKQLEVEELGSNIKFLKIIEENVRGRIWQGDLSQ